MDTSIIASRPLRFFAYGLGDLDMQDAPQNIPTTHSQCMQNLNSWGFATPPYGRVCDALEVIEQVSQIEHKREQYPMEIDGAVIKQNNIEAQKALSFTARAPRFAVAYKFAAMQVQTTLLNIEIQVGRTGALTPVGILEPVSVGGVVVSRATLHNEDEIKSKDVRIGDTVIVQRAGDVIPEIVGPVLNLRPTEAKEFDFPHICPICNEPAIREQGQAAWRCQNISCEAVLLQNIKYFVSKSCFNIQGIGQKWIEKLVEAKRVTNAADLFKLTVPELLQFERMGEVLAEKFVSAFNDAKEKVTLARFINALGIRHVGEQTAKMLAKNYSDIDILAQANIDELIALQDVGPEVAASIQNYFQNQSNKELLQQFKEIGINPKSKPSKALVSDENLAFYDKKVLFTGTLTMPRHEAIKLAEDNGAQILSSISKKLDYLVAGEKAGSKLDKALSLGVKVLSETEFLSLCNAQDKAKSVKKFTTNEQGSLI